jgi:hypothetical protein
LSGRLDVGEDGGGDVNDDLVALARGARIELEPVVPPTARIELADEIEEPRGGGVEVRGQLRDLVPEPSTSREHAASRRLVKRKLRRARETW